MNENRKTAMKIEKWLQKQEALVRDKIRSGAKKEGEYNR